MLVRLLAALLTLLCARYNDLSRGKAEIYLKVTVAFLRPFCFPSAAAFPVLTAWRESRLPCHTNVQQTVIIIIWF